MGSLIDRDDLIDAMNKKMVGAYAAKAAIKVVEMAPGIKAYPPRMAQLERRVYGDRAKYVCTACENTIPEHVIPARIHYCWHCGARITGVQDATK